MADGIAEVSSGRNCTQSRYGTLERFHDSIAPPEFGEGSCLILEYSGNGLDGVTILELLGEWVIRQCYASLFFVILQDNLEKVSKARRW